MFVEECEFREKGKNGKREVKNIIEHRCDGDMRCKTKLNKEYKNSVNHSACDFIDCCGIGYEDHSVSPICVQKSNFAGDL